jgi:hypothetical protein
MARASSRAGASLAILTVVAFAAGAPAAFALTETKPLESCRWDGTAPWCRGECEAGEVARDRAAEAERAQFAGFGKDCAGGIKVFCCTLRCPDGFLLTRAGEGSTRTCVAETGLPVGPQVITMPEGPVLFKKGPIEAPERAVGPKKDLPVAAPEPAPPPPAPVEPTVTVLLNVEVYDQPGGGGKRIGELVAGTPGVYLAEPCRADRWCHVKGNVPGGQGWVWSGPGYQSLQV